MLEHRGISKHLLFRILLFPQVFLDNSLLFHPFSPLLLLAILVPKAIKQHIFDLSSGVILSDHMQILLRLVSRDRFNIVDGQCLYYGLKGADVLDRVQ